MNETPNKSQEITDWFHKYHENQRTLAKELMTAKKYAQDLMEGKIIAPDSSGSYPLNYLFSVLMGNIDEDFAYQFLEFCVEKLKKKQPKNYWDKYVYFPFYSQFHEKYPNHKPILRKILEVCTHKDIPLPSNYWYWCYENPQFYFHPPELDQYPPILEMLVKAIHTQKGKTTLKNAEIQRIDSFKKLVENVLQNLIQNHNDFFEKDTFHLAEFYLPLIQISTENNYNQKNLLKDAENLLLLLAILQYEGSPSFFRQPIPFQELTAQPIAIHEFLGIDLTKISENLQGNIFEKLGTLEINKFDQNGMVYHVFQHPYAPNLKRQNLPYIPQTLTKEADKKAFVLQLLIKDCLLLDIESPENTEYQEIWSISTNTSHFFDAGNEWFGAKFWAIHNKIENKVSFLLSSFTD